MRLLKYQNQKGQNTAEYAILIGLVIAAAAAMQTYLGRNFKGAVKYAVDKHNVVGTTKLYEPYYIQQDYTTSTEAYKETEEMLQGGRVLRSVTSDSPGNTKNTTRAGTQQIKAPVEDTVEENASLK
jgi:hypothetical protein